MPNTSYTPACNHHYQLIQDLRKLIEDVVLPAVDARCAGNPQGEPKHYRVILYPFERIVLWLITLEQLNQTHNMEAIASEARGIFEHYLDLRWLQAFPDELSFERFRAFVDADHYRVAQKVVRHKRQTAGSTIDTSPHEECMRRLECPATEGSAKEPIADKIRRLWPDNDRCPDHWTGKDLRKRAEAIDHENKKGPQCADMYVQIYPILCGLMHAGPGPAHMGHTRRELHVAFAYWNAFMTARAATFVLCDLLGVCRESAAFAERLLQLEEYEQAAMHALRGATAE